VKRPRVLALAATSAVIAAVAAAGGYALISMTRPQPLGLASASSQTPAPTPLQTDPLAAACRQPAMPPSPAPSGLSGLWVIQPGSVVGYRAHEKFDELPSPNVAVARTDQVRGWLLVAQEGRAVRVETGCVAISLATLQSVDRLPGMNTADRDEVVRNFLHTEEHPYAVFQMYPALITADFAGGTSVHVRVSGALELNGVSKPADFDLEIRATGAQVAAAGNTTVVVGDYSIDLPEAGNGFVTVDPHITLEISLVFLKR
jgi:hypothetical protein